ncbi:MAG: hypothetical protein HOB33_08615 [Bacteroidetes Order II. Incertae sedis bacterium]|nr:hypothetical protein [Bacteroidetes Order II. bacterium]
MDHFARLSGVFRSFNRCRLAFCIPCDSNDGLLDLFPTGGYPSGQLASEKIAGAALDVFETEPLPKTSPLWNLDNAIISPHVSGNSILYNEKAAALFMENLQRYVDKRPLLNRISRELGY